MCYIKKITLSLFIQNIVCVDILKHHRKSLYSGESFPTDYLLPEKTVSTKSELEFYIKSLHRTVTYFHKEMTKFNDTEVNRALGMFFMKVVLKRAIRDDRDKLSTKHLTLLKDVIAKSEYFVSHYLYIVKRTLYDSSHGQLEYRVAKILKDDSAQVFSIEDFNKGRLKKWLLGNLIIYIKNMDNMTLTRETYAYITEHMDSFFISVGASDKCLSRVVRNPEPIDLSELRPCVPDPFCRKALLSSPSAAYALSHRLLNLLMLRHSRRCYIQTEKEDADLVDSLCAFMYREAVYLAKSGFFARDLFLEHVALCSLFGYEEFFRQRWFRKAASWMDDRGCISESHNFLMNRSRIQIEKEVDIKKQYQLRKRLKWTLLEECHSHPMALLIIVLAQAIRYTLNLIPE